MSPCADSSYLDYLHEGLQRDDTECLRLRYLPVQDGAPRANGVHEAIPDNVADGCPPSPASDISSASKKRARSPEDDAPPDKRPRFSESTPPPPEVPQFLPPFPFKAPDEAPLVEDTSAIDRGPTPPPLPTTSTADYRSSIPYEQSSLAEVPEWHLPEPLAVEPAPTRQSSHLALLTAYHFLLSDPNAVPAPSSNPARHKLAMQFRDLLAESAVPPDSIFSLSDPPFPRIRAPLPSHARAVDPALRDALTREFPPAATRPAVPAAPLSSSMSFHSSRLPLLSRTAVSVSKSASSAPLCSLVSAFSARARVSHCSAHCAA